MVVSEWCFLVRWGRTNVRDTANIGSLELRVVELLDGGGQVSSSLVLDVTFAGAGWVALSVDFTVDDVQAGLTCEVLEVLCIECEPIVSYAKVVADQDLQRSIFNR